MLRFSSRLNVLLGTALVFSKAFADDEARSQQIVVIGTVVDTGCYMLHDSKGPGHALCAAICAKAGVPLAILDAKGKLYTPIAADHRNQNPKLVPFIEKKVRVNGTLLEKGGLSGIVIKTVEAAE
jgi:hypothetical protein